MNDHNTIQDAMINQKAEFDALDEVIKAYKNLPAIVDDDYPEMRHFYEGTIYRFIEAIKNNKRLNSNTKALTFNQFQDKNEDRCVNGFKHNLKDWSLMEWGSATVGEIGEACNKAKKLKRIEQNIKGNKSHENELTLRHEMAKEICDGIIYSFLWLSAAGYKAEELIREVFNAKSDEINSNIKI